MRRDESLALLAATKPDLVLMDTDEINAETPAHLLDDDITPTHRLFARNAGLIPTITAEAANAWTLRIDGQVHRAQNWTIPDLRRRYRPVTQAAVLECAGNGRAFFPQPTSIVMWTRGAVGCVEWTGVRLADLLDDCGLLPDAVYTGQYSPDVMPDGSPALSRGIPIAKALAPETLVAYAVNGEPLPLMHGGPLRMVVPGYPGAAWQKWLARIAIRDREHDGARMTGVYYRMPRHPVRPGEPVDPAQFEVITDMPVRSVITAPRDGFQLPAGRPLAVRGHAWSGHIPLAAVDVSFDDAKTWQRATLGPPRERFAWRRFETILANPPVGGIAIVARAVDADGTAQPLESVAWNPRGYCNNMIHRIHGAVG